MKKFLTIACVMCVLAGAANAAENVAKDEFVKRVSE